MRKKLGLKQKFSVLLFVKENEQTLKNMSSFDSADYISKAVGLHVSSRTLEGIKRDVGIECFRSRERKEEALKKENKDRNIDVVARCLRDLYRHLCRDVPPDLLSIANKRKF
jgi:hypothetical protein